MSMAIGVQAVQPPPADLTDKSVDKASSDQGAAVLGRMHFLTRDPKYTHEKPYTLRYTPAPESGIPQTNIARVEHPVVFHDLRDRTDLKYEACGFGVVNLDNANAADAEGERPVFSYDDYAHNDRIEKEHAPRVLQAVHTALGAASADLIDYVVRRRHESWPVSTGQPYAFQQPASRAHIDHTYAGGVAVIREAYGDDADAVLSRRWQLVK